jgi:hypothetical protein
MRQAPQKALHTDERPAYEDVAEPIGSDIQVGDNIRSERGGAVMQVQSVEVLFGVSYRRADGGTAFAKVPGARAVKVEFDMSSGKWIEFGVFPEHHAIMVPPGEEIPTGRSSVVMM